MLAKHLPDARWRKSTRSANSANCVEIADNMAGIVPVRDSKNPTGPALVVERAAFAAFVAGIKGGQLG